MKSNMQSNDATNSYEHERRQKREKLRELGVDPYGRRTAGIRPLAQIKALYHPDMGHDGGPRAKAAGRVMLKRDMGKLSFLTLRDESGDLQVALDKRRLDDTGWNVRGLIDLGDLVVVEGPLGATNKGEVTLWASHVAMAAKALLPPPAKWEGLSDVEARYRQRYVDLWANPDVMRVLKLRIRVVEEIRRYMRQRGYLEVETPMMQPLAGGAAARPFITHHNALDMPLYLRIAPELYLKRLLVGGFTKVFELNRNFRNEGISPRHNPEFTMLEAYEAFGSWETMADLVEGMICHIAANVAGLPATSAATDDDRERVSRRAFEIYCSGAGGAPEHHWWQAQRELGVKIEHRNDAGAVIKTINLRRPWRRVTLVDLVEERTGWKFDGRKLQDAAPGALERLREAGARPALLELNAQEQLVEVYEKLIEPTLIDPCFVTHLPSGLIPLARESAEHPRFADVYELAINGQEISPGYTELNDPDVQAKHFAEQLGDETEKHKTDDDFLNALRYGMPPAGGMGIGIDRLVMMLTGAASIRDVILFPLMKPREAGA
jgi:lysyl-tRNA synthetase class 2